MRESRARSQRSAAQQQSRNTQKPSSETEEEEEEEEEAASQRTVEDEEERGRSDEEDEASNNAARVKLRSKYRTLINRVAEQKDTMSTEVLTQTIRENDKLFNEVAKHPHAREATLDYELTEMTMNLAMNNAGKMTSGFKAHSIDQFLAKMTELGPTNAFYMDYVRPFVSNNTPSDRHFLNGVLDRVVVPVVRERQRREKQPDAEKSQPTTVDNRQREEADLTKRIRALYQELERRTDSGQNALDLWEFVLEEKFCTTVENLFHFSFIVAEGHASLECLEDNSMLVNLSQPPDQNAVATGEVKGQQAVVRLDYRHWKELITARHRKNGVQHQINNNNNNNTSSNSNNSNSYNPPTNNKTKNNSNANKNSPAKKRRKIVKEEDGEIEEEEAANSQQS